MMNIKIFTWPCPRASQTDASDPTIPMIIRPIRLKETRYGDLLEGMDHAENFDQVLQEELAKQAKLVEDLVEEDALEEFLFLKYDIHNLKVLIKEFSREGESDEEGEDDDLSSLAYPFGHLFLPDVKEWIREPNRNPKLTETIL